jgi:probable rRNA maturation factor
MNPRQALIVDCRVPAGAAAPSRRSLASWASAALGARGNGRELALKVVSAAQMRVLNRRYRGKDKPTNVLAFPAADMPGVKPAPLGDVVICPSVLRQEAQAQGKSERSHWAHLVVHGALHLVGYDHERGPADARRMERREARVLRAMGFPHPYRLAARG